MYELIIIGGGPGGVAAGVYAARKKINTLLITDSFGGQSVVSSDIQNWIGEKSVSGFDLAKMLEEHLRAQEGLDIIDTDRVAEIRDADGRFVVATQNGRTLEAKFLLVASGGTRRKLNIPGEKELDGKGVVYCSTCDAPLFKGKDVAVVGGGNAGLEAVIDLFPYAKKIYALELQPELKGDQVTQEKVRANPQVTVLVGAQILRITGRDFVDGLVYKDLKSGEEKTLPVQGVFVEIGAVPNAGFVKGLVKTNPLGEIVVDHLTEQTSHPRIWAVGDVTDVRYKQNNISVGDGVKAALSIDEALHKR